MLLKQRDVSLIGRTETRIQNSGSQAVGGSYQFTTSQDTPRYLCIKTQDKPKLYKMQAPYIRASLSWLTIPEHPPPPQKIYFLCSVLYLMYVYLPDVPQSPFFSSSTPTKLLMLVSQTHRCRWVAMVTEEALMQKKKQEHQRKGPALFLGYAKA